MPQQLALTWYIIMKFRGLFTCLYCLLSLQTRILWKQGNLLFIPTLIQALSQNMFSENVCVQCHVYEVMYSPEYLFLYLTHCRFSKSVFGIELNIYEIFSLIDFFSDITLSVWWSKKGFHSGKLVERKQRIKNKLVWPVAFSVDIKPSLKLCLRKSHCQAKDNRLRVGPSFATCKAARPFISVLEYPVILGSCGSFG